MRCFKASGKYKEKLVKQRKNRILNVSLTTLLHVILCNYPRQTKLYCTGPQSEKQVAYGDDIQFSLSASSNAFRTYLPVKFVYWTCRNTCFTILCDMYWSLGHSLCWQGHIPCINSKYTYFSLQIHAATFHVFASPKLYGLETLNLEKSRLNGNSGLIKKNMCNMVGFSNTTFCSCRNWNVWQL